MVMNPCAEFILDDVMAVTAIPLSDFAVGMSPWHLNPVVLSDEFSPDLSNAITIGLQPPTSAGINIPIKRATGKASDEETNSVAGRLHTVVVSCDVDDRNPDVWQHLLSLERIPAHLLLHFRDGTRALVLASMDTYLCTIGRDGAKTTVEFRIQNLMGIQLVV